MKVFQNVLIKEKVLKVHKYMNSCLLFELLSCGSHEPGGVGNVMIGGPVP